MLKGFKYRIYPTDLQSDLINRHIGASRFLYNLALETKESAFNGNKYYISEFDMINQLPDLKKELPWLKEICATSLQQSVKHLYVAYKNFLKGNANPPRYKSKWNGNQSYKTLHSHIRIYNGKLSIPKFREGIKIKMHREFEGKIKSVTVSRTPTGKYFASILCDTGEECKPKPQIDPSTTIGVDLGLTDFTIDSNGCRVGNPRYYVKSEAKLKYAQRKYSKHKGKRAKKKIARLHEKVANQRKDFLHKQSTRLVKENHSIAVENLSVDTMQQNRYLSKSIGDVGWGMFVSMLEYKSEWYGTNLIKIDKYAPSSKTCSCCGKVNESLTLDQREWICTNCMSKLDRDINAAVNIKSFALNKVLSRTDSQNQNELPTLVGVKTSEAID